MLLSVGRLSINCDQELATKLAPSEAPVLELGNCFLDFDQPHTSSIAILFDPDLLYWSLPLPLFRLATKTGKSGLCCFSTVSHLPDKDEPDLSPSVMIHFCFSTQLVNQFKSFSLCKGLNNNNLDDIQSF